MLKEEFIAAAVRYASAERGTELWEEIEAAGHEAGRHYHTLEHFEHVLQKLVPHKNVFIDWDIVVFAVAYHDAVYNTLSKNNEEKSALLAEKRLTSIGFPADKVKRCKAFILATKHHESVDDEINLFTDADLSNLGADPDTYTDYTLRVRREYWMYPEFLYNPGRKKVLHHFLKMSGIYKTPNFKTRYEAQARVNLNTELQTL